MTEPERVFDTRARRLPENTRAVRIREPRVWHIPNCCECGGAMFVYTTKRPIRYTKCSECGSNGKWIPDAPRMVPIEQDNGTAAGTIPTGQRHVGGSVVRELPGDGHATLRSN